MSSFVLPRVSTQGLHLMASENETGLVEEEDQKQTSPVVARGTGRMELYFK
jgi:hypothetical protein